MLVTKKISSLSASSRLSSLFTPQNTVIERKYWRTAKEAAAIPPTTQPHHAIWRKKKKKQEKKTTDIVKNPSGQLIIACKRKELNYHRGDRYGNKRGELIGLKHLASGGWLHYKSKGDYFTILPHHSSTILDKTSTFNCLGVNNELFLSLLKQQNIHHPSQIQVEAIPHLLDGENVICAAETGSGKTLAYLLPVLHKLSTFRDVFNPEVMNATCPRAVVIVPSKELADQVAAMAKPFCEALNLSLLSVSGSNQNHKLVSSLKAKPRDIDLFISTPGSMSVFLSSKAVSSALINHVIIDEADTLLDDSFNDLTVKLLRKLSTKSSGILGIQVILVSATFPKDLKGILGDTMQTDGFVQCTTSALHHVIGNISQKFIRMGPQDKPDNLTAIFSKNASKPTMVFANTSATAGYLYHLLTSKNIKSVLLHGKLPEEERQGVFQSFKDGEVDVMIASDIASRGLDTVHVAQVINYDIPRYMSDYVHRAGRIGRLGSQHADSSIIISLVGHRPEVKLIWEIERAVRGGDKLAKLPNVHANITRHINKQIEKKYPYQEESLFQ